MIELSIESVLLSGKCNERLVQAKFVECKNLPKYRIFSCNDQEAKYFEITLKELGKELCLNILNGGNNVASHKEDSVQVYSKISSSLKEKYKSSEQFRGMVRKACEISSKNREKRCKFEEKTFNSLKELSAQTGIPNGSIGNMIKKGKITLL